MSSTKRFVVCALLSMAALSAAAASQAQSPLDGTWQVNLAQTKFSPKPLTFYISQGWYHCAAAFVLMVDLVGRDDDILAAAELGHHLLRRQEGRQCHV